MKAWISLQTLKVVIVRFGQTNESLFYSKHAFDMPKRIEPVYKIVFSFNFQGCNWIRNALQYYSLFLVLNKIQTFFNSNGYFEIISLQNILCFSVPICSLDTVL